uniref:ZP domain-containing protein n=1 Tax=Elaeophora elaphi TaxID=1147741 RepID=A0A0R3RWE9_9BILA
MFLQFQPISKIGPKLKGIEQSITIVVSFHDIFITKIDRAFRCTCFYMEADRVVTARFDVSMIPTTDLIDTVRMPLCTYTVRRDSVIGKAVSVATVGEPVIHVWQCESGSISNLCAKKDRVIMDEMITFSIKNDHSLNTALFSDMFSILVHSCFVDDGNGHEKKPLIDERGCTIEPIIIPDLTYTEDGNMAFSKVNVFKFADKLTTYFQCAVSTCMRSEGRCNEQSPPHCANDRLEHFGRRTTQSPSSTGTASITEKATSSIWKFRKSRSAARSFASFLSENETLWMKYDGHTMDLSAGKIVVLDLDEERSTTGIENALSSQVR